MNNSITNTSVKRMLRQLVCEELSKKNGETDWQFVEAVIALHNPNIIETYRKKYITDKKGVVKN